MDRKTDNENKGRVLRFKRDPAFYAKLGDKKRSQNDPVSAIARYNEALSIDPHDLDTRLAAAEVLTDMMRFNDSNKLLIPYMHEDEDFRREAYCVAGFNLLGMNETEGARNCFNRFFDMTDEVSERTDAMLDALDYIDSFDDDQPILQDAEDKERGEMSARAGEAFEKGDFETSANILRELVRKDPNDKNALYDLALSCLCSYNAAESETYVDRLLELDEDNWPAWSLKLMYAKGRKNEIEIKKICRKLEKCDSVLPDELFRVNGSLLEADCPELALKLAERLVKLLPFDALANHRLAISYAKLRQFKKAAEVYAKLLRIDSRDYIADYYRTLLVRLDNAFDERLFSELSMLQYQLPFDRVIEIVKELLSSKILENGDVTENWERSEELRSIVRWAFSLHEFNIEYAMLNLLRIIRSESAELMIREAIADIDAGRGLVNEGLGALKRRNAAEPYFAMLDGSLIEGRVNLVDASKAGVPKNYLRIFPRFGDSAKELYPVEVISAGGTIAERFIISLKGSYPRISNDQSAALSAAVEYLACDQCGITIRDDVLDRYGITQKRLVNAIDRIVSSVIEASERGSDGEGD